MNTPEVAAALVALGFYSPEAGSFQISRGNVIIGVDLYAQGAEVDYTVGMSRMGTHYATNFDGLVAELKTADTNFKGYPGYSPLFNN